MSSGSETALKIRQAEIISERDAALAEIERLRAEIARLKKPRGYHDVDDYYRDEAKEVQE